MNILAAHLNTSRATEMYLTNLSIPMNKTSAPSNLGRLETPSFWALPGFKPLFYFSAPLGKEDGTQWQARRRICNREDGIRRWNTSYNKDGWNLI